MTALVETIDALDARMTQVRSPGTRIGFVPTMGALHAGHAALIERARRECTYVVVSVFVNPLQFDRPDDLERYPRTLDADLELCRAVGTDAVFAPSAHEMYPREPTTRIGVGALGLHLCGADRPGHFEGVATVVAKLLNIVRPDRAYFGEKDAQQLAIIRRLVADLSVPVEIVGVATVREADGLALSSRNRLLSPEERQQAPVLYRALGAAAGLVAAGEVDAGRVVEAALREIPRGPGLKIEYLEVVDPDGLQPVARVEAPVLVAGALWVGSTRLIDNIVCAPGGRNS
jgi:pantoate--beta-alanine ligase